MAWAAIGGAIGGAVLGSVTGERAAKHGASIDKRSKLRTEEALWGRAQERGLTPQEYYGSSAPGGAMGASGAGQVLGNSMNQQSAAMSQAAQQTSENEKDRVNAKEIAQIQAGTQTRGQDITAGTTQRGQDITANTQSNILNFQKKNYLQIQVPQAAANLNKTTQEVNKIINEVATSTPKFIKMLKVMTMGSDNSYGLAIQNMLGIDISDPKQMESLSPDMRRKLLAGLLSGSSTAAKELSGITGSISQWIDTMAASGGKIIDSLTSTSSMEQTKPQLGNKQKTRHRGQTQH